MEAKLTRMIGALRNHEQYFRRAIVENQEEILDLNIAQLESGKDSFGRLLDEYASDAYAQFKQSIGSRAPFGIPDLKLEGDFYSGFVLKADGDEFYITSEDEKRDKLVAYAGPDIFGLTEESLIEARQYILESFLIILRNELL